MQTIRSRACLIVQVLQSPDYHPLSVFARQFVNSSALMGRAKLGSMSDLAPLFSRDVDALSSRLESAALISRNIEISFAE